MVDFITFGDCPGCHQPMKVVKTETPESTIIIFEQCSTCDHEDTYEVVEEENACHA